MRRVTIEDAAYALGAVVGLALAGAAALQLRQLVDPPATREARRRADKTLLQKAEFIAQHNPDAQLRVHAERIARGMRFWIRSGASGGRPPRGLPSGIHGGYCGLGGGGAIRDELDRACAEHDAAYEAAAGLARVT